MSAWACSLIIALTTAQADVPQQSPLRVEAEVLSIDGEAVLLKALSLGRPMSPEMLMTVLDGQEAVAVVRVDSVRGTRAHGTITENVSGRALSSSMRAVAPCPLPITALEGNVAHIALPRGHGLPHGTVLHVVRDGRDIGTAALSLADQAPPWAVPIADPSPISRTGRFSIPSPPGGTLTT